MAQKSADATDEQKALRKMLEAEFNGMRLWKPAMARRGIVA